jgi:hypothetical protein
MLLKPLEGQFREVAIVPAGHSFTLLIGASESVQIIGARPQLDYPQRRGSDLPVAVFILALELSLCRSLSLILSDAATAFWRPRHPRAPGRDQASFSSSIPRLLTGSGSLAMHRGASDAADSAFPHQ